MPATMSDDARAPNCHDALVHNVFGRSEALAPVLRRLLPRDVLPHVDFSSLRSAPTKQTNEWLRGRRCDLHAIVDFIDGNLRMPVHLLIEHQSTPEARMPKRAHGYVGGFWDEYINDHPEDEDTVPFVLPILFTQYPARNTPTRLSDIQALSPRLRSLLGTPVELTMLVDDFSGSIMDDLETPLPTRALVELARAFLYAYKNPGALTEQRMAELAPLFDVLLEQKRPGDVRMLWVYVISAFETGSPLRALILQAVSKRAKEDYMTIAEDLLEKGRAEGQAIGQAKSLLRVLERRAIAISAAVRERVLATRDDSLLQRWLDRALAVTTAEEVFGPLEA
jgi:Putative transposase, YhgA-like